MPRRKQKTGPATPAKGIEQSTVYVEILSTYNRVEVAFLKSQLKAEGIDCYFWGENFTGPNIQPVRIFVREDQAEKVKEMLKDILPDEIRQPRSYITHSKSLRFIGSIIFIVFGGPLFSEGPLMVKIFGGLLVLFLIGLFLQLIGGIGK